MSPELELDDVIKLTEECCDKRALFPYVVVADWSCGGESEVYIICSNCRMNHRWIKSEPKLIQKDLIIL